MIQRLALFITNRWVQTGIVSSEKSEVYVYGLDIVISTIWISLLVVISSLLYGDILYAVFYYVCFFPLRGYCGGYHAKTHWGCALLQLVSFTVTVSMSAVTNVYVPYILIVILFAAMVTLVALFAPIEHPDNPIDCDKKKGLRRNGLITLIVVLPISITLSYFGMAIYSNILVFSSVVSIVSMLFTKIKYRLKKPSGDTPKMFGSLSGLSSE